MTDPTAPSRRLIAGCLATLLIVVGCGSAVTPGPSRATPSSARASSSPSASARALPSASSTTDAASGITIGPPYVLTGNPNNPSLTGTFNVDLAGTRVEAIMNGREIRRDTKLVGLVLVMKFSGIRVSPQVFDGAAKGAAANAAGTLTYSTISGHRVAFITSKTATFGLYPRGDSILMVGGPNGTDAKTLLTSVIKANE